MQVLYNNCVRVVSDVQRNLSFFFKLIFTDEDHSRVNDFQMGPQLKTTIKLKVKYKRI